MAGIVVPQPNHDGTLLRLMQLRRQLNGLNGRHSVTLHCTVRVLGVRGRNSWHYFSCGATNCMKGLTRVENSFWCKSCDRICKFPVARFRLELDVSDPSMTLFVTVFDEIAESMVLKHAVTLLQAHEDDEENEIPHEVLQLVNTTHVLELKTHTYYDHGVYATFTVPPPGTDVPHFRAALEAVDCKDAKHKAIVGTNGDKGITSVIGAVAVYSKEHNENPEEQNEDAKSASSTPVASPKSPVDNEITSPK